MGLDMFLIRRDKVSSETIDDEAAYWRKANQIRQWFVVNTNYPKDGNTTPHNVTREQLKNLVSDCRKVIECKELAEKILPPSFGYWFGSTDIDDYYFDTVRETVGMVNRVIEETDWDNEDVCYYEWW